VQDLGVSMNSERLKDHVKCAEKRRVNIVITEDRFVLRVELSSDDPSSLVITPRITVSRRVIAR